jgi:hypothetical protein
MRAGNARAASGATETAARAREVRLHVVDVMRALRRARPPSAGRMVHDAGSTRAARAARGGRRPMSGPFREECVMLAPLETF